MKPSEHKTVQARILEYAEAIDWTFVPREDAEERRTVFSSPTTANSGRALCGSIWASMSRMKQR